MNPAVATILEILKYVIPALVVLIATNMVVGRFLNGQFRQKTTCHAEPDTGCDHPLTVTGL